MLDTVLYFVCDLDRGIGRTLIRPALLTGDRQAHTFRIAVKRSGEYAALTGASVSAYFVRADGVTVPITGSVEGSAAEVTLPEGCYRVPGRFQLVVKLSMDSGISTVFWGDGAVATSSTDAILDEEDVIPSLDELLAKIAAAEAAAASATSAASDANSAASSANTAASRADAAAVSIEQISAQATTLAPGSQATAAWSTVDGAKVLTIGVPQGIQGPQGPKGDPGKDGSGSVSSVNGIASVAGNVTLTASDVGALEADGTAANAAMLGGKAPEYYMQPRNLLDDSDFTNPVNQRGATSYSTQWTYTIDRWYLPGSTVPVTVGEGYVSFCTADQFIGKEIKDGYYTAAIKLLDGRVFSGSAYYTAGETATMLANNGVIDCYLMGDAGSGGHPRLRFQTVSGEAISFVWAALYEGAYTADTLPPYVPKGYAAELLECLRYYRTLNVLFGTDIGSVTRQIINYTPPMRISPTASAAVTSGSSSTASATINAATDRYIDIATNSWGNALVTLSADL